MDTSSFRKLWRDTTDELSRRFAALRGHERVRHLEGWAAQSPAVSRLRRALPDTGGQGLRRRATQLGIVLCLGVLAGVGVGAVIHIPSIDSLGDFAPSLITELRAEDGAVFRSYARERRMMLEEG